jgi:rRNA processing protein Krr1/Pno1
MGDLTRIFLIWHSDPHVRVAGEPESVRAAKERIMAVLDTRVKSKIVDTLKIDMTISCFSSKATE